MAGAATPTTNVIHAAMPVNAVVDKSPQQAPARDTPSDSPGIDAAPYTATPPPCWSPRLRTAHPDELRHRPSKRYANHEFGLTVSICSPLWPRISLDRSWRFGDTARDVVKVPVS
jgi:hypothetical protein